MEVADAAGIVADGHNSNPSGLSTDLGTGPLRRTVGRPARSRIMIATNSAHGQNWKDVQEIFKHLQTNSKYRKVSESHPNRNKCTAHLPPKVLLGHLQPCEDSEAAPARCNESHRVSRCVNFTHFAHGASMDHCFKVRQTCTKGENSWQKGLHGSPCISLHQCKHWIELDQIGNERRKWSETKCGMKAMARLRVFRACFITPSKLTCAGRHQRPTCRMKIGHKRIYKRTYKRTSDTKRANRQKKNKKDTKDTKG